jgi:hypothetical protein
MTGWDHDHGAGPEDGPGDEPAGPDGAGSRERQPGEPEVEVVGWQDGTGERPDATDPAGWSDPGAEGADPFPPALDMDVTPAVDGPWVDPGLLGEPDDWAGADPAGPADPPEAILPDLAAADGNPDADWSALRDSEDPAVRALTTHWTR